MISLWNNILNKNQLIMSWPLTNLIIIEQSMS